MTTNTDRAQPDDENSVILLYYRLLDNWNRCDAADFAGLFALQGAAVGFDGSQMNGRQEIGQQLEAIFSSHSVASYVGITREVKKLSPEVYMLKAVAGMVPPGKDHIKPDVNAIQTLIAVREENGFKITLFQNTPAAFHGRPELVTQLTQELQQAFNNKGASHE